MGSHSFSPDSKYLALASKNESVVTIWDVLKKHRDQFSYSPPEDEDEERHPWREQSL